MAVTLCLRVGPPLWVILWLPPCFGCQAVTARQSIVVAPPETLGMSLRTLCLAVPVAWWQADSILEASDAMHFEGLMSRLPDQSHLYLRHCQ